jgi:predicted DNA-binding antitoxin AbrB/MazE fold protein
VEQAMTEKVEAIYSGGVFIPERKLSLRDQQRVRLMVEAIDEPKCDRAAAVARLKAGIASMNFFSQGTAPQARRSASLQMIAAYVLSVRHLV